MNKERLLELADLLETEKVAKHWDMDNYFVDEGSRMNRKLGTLLDNCGAAACIAGWSIAKFDPDTPINYSEVKDRAASILDMDWDDASALFTPETVTTWTKISPTDAAQTIRSYVETGVVDWSWHPAYEGEIEDDED